MGTPLRNPSKEQLSRLDPGPSDDSSERKPMPRAPRLQLVFLVFSLAVALPSAVSQIVVGTLPVGASPDAVAVNSVTDKIYVTNQCGNDPNCKSAGTVTVIDGATNNTMTVSVGYQPRSIAVNSVTNKIYLTNQCGNDPTCKSPGTVTVIDGATNNTTTVSVGYGPQGAAGSQGVAVNSVTNQIYVVNACGSDPSCAGGTVTVIDGVTNNTTSVNVGNSPDAVALDSVTNKIYVVDFGSASVTVIDGATNNTLTVSVGFAPYSVAVDSVTNKVYVVNLCGSDPLCHHVGTVTVIDGATNKTTSVNVGLQPSFAAVDPVTNQIYVANTGASYGGDTVTVIDGTTLSTDTVIVGTGPWAVAVNSATNQIYVTDKGSADLTTIDGATNSTGNIHVGNLPVAEAVNDVTNTVYVANSPDDTVTVVAGAVSGSYYLNVSLSPNGSGTVTSTDGFINCPGVCYYPYPVNTQVTLNATPAQGWAFTGWSGACSGTGSCVVTMTQDLSVGATFTQLSYTLTVSTIGSGTVTSTDGTINCPGTCTHSYLSNTEVTLNATPAQGWTFNGWSGACSGSGSCMVTMTQALSVNAIFAGIGASQFIAASPCRVADTRNPDGEFGGPPLPGGTVRNFVIPDNLDCGIPATAAAYSLNVTVVPPGPLGFLTIWPTGESQPNVSTLNSYDGRVKATAAIVPAGSQGAVSVFVSDTTHVVLDIDGYFAPVSNSTLAFYPLPPCRVADTRDAVGDLGGPFLTGGVPRDFPVPESTCGVSNTAQAYSLNFTAVPHGPLGFLTVWPTGQTQPVVSTLNSYSGQLVANAAIVPAGTRWQGQHVCLERHRPGDRH